MTVYDMANYSTGGVEAAVTFILFNTFLCNRAKTPKWIYYISFVLLACLINFSNHVFNVSFINYIAIVIMTLLVSLAYEGSWKIRIMSATLSFTLSTLSEICTLLVMSLVTNHNINVIVYDVNLRLLGIFISKVVALVVALYIKYRAIKKIELVDTGYWFLFTIVFIGATVNMYIFYTVLSEVTESHIRNLLLISTLCIVLTMIIVLFLYEKTITQHFQMSKQTMEQHQLNNQLRHYKAMVLSQENIKGLRHDMKNHLLSIYAKIKRQEFSECLKYINNMLDKTSVTDNFEIDTGNTVLDAILSAKKEEAIKNNIKFISELRIPQGIPVHEDDICIIFGNLLDNAIEAAVKVKQNPYVSISMVYDGENLICRVENSCITNAKEAIFTTKQDIKNHGIGRANIKRSMNNYDTVSHVIHENGKYVFSIIFMNI